MTTESKIQSRILGQLRKINDSEWVKPTVTNKNGETDIIGHIKGLAIYIEVKKGDDEEPRKLQEYRIDKHKRMGAISFWTSGWTDCRLKLRTALISKGVML